MTTPTTPYHRTLDGGLTLKSIKDVHDGEKIIALNGQVFGEDVAQMTRSFMLHHPAIRPEHWLYVEDDATGKAVSTLVLIPWTWRYENITIRSGEMGIVATDETYRNRGLIRQLVMRHKELLQEGDFDFSHIQGIPYFYRQFGYEYALPLEPNWHLELHNIPETPPEAIAQYSFRPATLDDIPVLMRMYDAATRCLDISAIRDAEAWGYMLQHTSGTADEGETWLMLDSSQQVVGSWRLKTYGFGKGLIVSETSRLSYAQAEVLLHHLKPIAAERGKPSIRLNVSVTNDLLKVAQLWGATNPGTYAWQMHIVNPAKLFRKLAPVIERRIAGSIFAGFSEKVYFNLYRETLELHFDNGKLVGVNALGAVDKGEIRIPPLLLAPLVLGYRSHEELRQSHPDVNIWGKGRLLVDVMFPKMESFIYGIY